MATTDRKARKKELLARVDALPTDARDLVFAHSAAMTVQARWRARVSLRPGDEVRFSAATWRVVDVERPPRGKRAFVLTRELAGTRSRLTVWVYDRARVTTQRCRAPQRRRPAGAA